MAVLISELNCQHTNLQRGPVPSNDHPDVFDGGYERERDPGYDQTFASQLSSADENHRAENTEESIKDRVFDERSYTDVLVFTLLFIIGIIILGVFDHIEDGGDDGDDQLQDSDDDDGCPQVQAKDRLETRFTAAHLVGSKKHFWGRLVVLVVKY